MSGSNFSLSVDASAVAYLEEKIKGVFGKDAETVDWNRRLVTRTKAALEQARWVQCVGMDRPVAIHKIYQPIGLQGASGERRAAALPTDIWRLMSAHDAERKHPGTDAVIFAGPGRGKSTLLNWVFIRLHDKDVPDEALKDAYTPFLFILRSENAVDDLEEFVKRATSERSGRNRQRILLLVDGYDEIPEESRKRVSTALVGFKAGALGNFFLSCRTFYDVYDLRVSSYWLASFSRDDVLRFVESFAQCYEAEIDPEWLVTQLEERDLWEFARHPLMLTLVCILKTGPLPELPRRSVSLLQRALDTLTLRWDQQRGIHRQSSAPPIDGTDHIEILKQIAFKMRALITSQETLVSCHRSM